MNRRTIDGGTRRLACWILVGLCLVSPAAADSPPPVAPLRLLTQTVLTEDAEQRWTVDRLLAWNQASAEVGAGLRLLDATVDGSLVDVVEVANRADGPVKIVGADLECTPSTPPWVLLSGPKLTMAHADVTWDETGLHVGARGADGRPRLPAGGWPAETSATLDPADWSRWALVTLPPDAVLAAAFDAVLRPSEEQVSRKLSVRLARPPGQPVIEGELELQRVSKKKGRERFEFKLTWSGQIRTNKDHVLEREQEGHLIVDATGPVSAKLKGVTRVRSPEKVLTNVTHSTRLTRSHARVDAARESLISEALALRASDFDAFRHRTLLSTIERTQPLLAALRSDVAELPAFRAVVWTEQLDARALMETSSGAFSDAFAEIWLPRVGRLIAEFGPVSASEVEDLIQSYSGSEAGPHWATAFAIEDRLIVVRPAAIGSRAVITHELAHLADHAAGWVDESRLAAWNDEGPDPNWVDLDASVAAVALEEACAEISEAFVQVEEDHPGKTAHVWKRLNKQGDAGSAGRTEDLLRGILDFLYRGSGPLVAARHEKRMDLRATLDAAWASFSYSTREFFRPTPIPPASRLWPAVVARRTELEAGGVEGGTRVGALMLRQMLGAREACGWDEADELARALVDDVALRGSEGVSWRLDMESDSTAASLRAVLETLANEERSVTLVGRTVVVTIRKGALPTEELVNL